MKVVVGTAREGAVGVRSARVCGEDVHVFDGDKAVADVKGEALVQPVARPS
jgi:hypothetical protein